MIDPTSSAINWIKTHLKQKNVEVTTQESPKFNTTIELAIRFGKILIVEEVNQVSPILLPILRKEFVYQGERKLITLNGKLIDYHNDFQLILSSRDENLQLPTNLVAVLSKINFTITHAGLTEQLLNNAIRQESPKLEERKKQLSKEREEMQQKLHDLQNQLLEDLAASTGDILQNKVRGNIFILRNFLVNF